MIIVINAKEETMVGIKWTDGLSKTKEEYLKRDHAKLKESKDEKALLEWFLEGEIDVVEILNTETLNSLGFAPRINGVIVTRSKDSYLFPDMDMAFIEAFEFRIASKKKLEKLKPKEKDNAKATD